MSVALLIILMMVSCTLADPYDKTTTFDKFRYTKTYNLAISKVFDRLNESGKKGGICKLAGLMKKCIDSDAPAQADIEYANLVLSRMDQATGRCDRDSYVALFNGYASTLYGKGPQSFLDPNRETDSRVIKALQRHGEHCRPQYARLMKSLQARSADRQSVKTVEKILTEDLIKLLFPEQDPRTMVRASDIVSHRFPAFVPRSMLIDNLRDSAEGTEWASQIRHKDDLLADVINETLSEPCAHFVEIYEEIFLPARLDLVLGDEKIKEINPEEDPEFELTWARFRVCGALANNSIDTFMMINRKMSRD